MLKDAHPEVIAAIAYALRKLDVDEALELMLPYVVHADADVRHAVVHALLTNEDERAIAALIRLSSDDDASIRDWATFGLGSQVDLDTPEIREALQARLTDPDAETRAEAIKGLENRGVTVDLP